MGKNEERTSDKGVEDPPKPKRRKVLQPVENCPPIRSKALTIKEIVEKMKGIREDARRIKDSNSGAVGGSDNLQNCRTSEQVPKDVGEERPTEGVWVQLRMKL